MPSKPTKRRTFNCVLLTIRGVGAEIVVAGRGGAGVVGSHTGCSGKLIRPDQCQSVRGRRCHGAHAYFLICGRRRGPKGAHFGVSDRSTLDKVEVFCHQKNRVETKTKKSSNKIAWLFFLALLKRVARMTVAAAEQTDVDRLEQVDLIWADSVRFQ